MHMNDDFNVLKSAAIPSAIKINKKKFNKILKSAFLISATFESFPRTFSSENLILSLALDPIGSL